ncbi:MAG: hypothetical protein CMK59_00120 [Proteobacteria bacterium]|nr:hypothetical protein [Pseudomonadota bacterium]
MLSFLVSVALAVPVEMNHQGRLTDTSGLGLTGSHMLTFRIHDASNGGNVMWSEIVVVNISDGFYSVQLGQNTALDSAVLEQYPLWLEIQLDGNAPMTPRHTLSSVPYSFVSEVAEVASSVEGYVDATEVSVNGTTVIDSGGNWVGPTISNAGASTNPDWTDIQNRPSGLDDGDDDSFAGYTCSNGEVLEWSGTGWTCASSSSFSGAQLTEQEVENYISNGTIDLASGSSMNGDGLVTQSDLSSPMNLAQGSTMGGDALVTQSDLSAPDWNSMTNIPADLLDGDGDSFASISCAAGEGISWDGTSWVCVSLIVDFADLTNVPAEFQDGDADSLGVLSCADGQVPMYSAADSGWICGDAGGAAGQLAKTNIIGESDGGMSYDSLDTNPPAVIPNNNVAGFTSARFVSDIETITTLSIDLQVTHPEMGEITAVLTSPSGTSVTIYDGDHAGQADFDGNLGWELSGGYPINSGDLYSFYGETTEGIWSLNITDNIDANADGDVFSGTLDGWTLHFNEGWDGTMFIGNNLTVHEQIAVHGELRVDYGGDFILTNTDGEETFKIEAETGKVTIGGNAGGSTVDFEEFIPQVFWVSGDDESNVSSYGNGGCYYYVDDYSQANCPEGSAYISGRCELLGSVGEVYNPYQSGESWLCSARACSPGQGQVVVRARALCMNTAP